MPTCSNCKKKGLFLKLNPRGLCPSCAEKALVCENRDVLIMEQREKRNALIKEREEKRKAFIKSQEKKFDEKIFSLPVFPMVLSEHKIKRNTLSSMPEFKFSNITKRTNLNKLSNYVVLDVETTGLDKRKSKIIEISAIKVESNNPTSIFTTLINPQTDIPSEITKLTGITNSLVSQSPFFYQIIPSFLDFLGNSNIVGHNLDFDLKFMYVNGIDFFSIDRKYYDTLNLAKKILKVPKVSFADGDYCRDWDSDWDVQDYKLETLCDYYSIFRSTAHRSASDCLATQILFSKLIDSFFYD